MNIWINFLVGATLFSAVGCGLPPPREDKDYEIELVIENRLSSRLLVGSAYPEDWTEVAAGATSSYKTQWASVEFRMPEVKAFAISRLVGNQFDDWQDQETVLFRGNVTGIHGGEFMARESRVYYFAPAEDTAVFMARAATPPSGTPPSEAFSEGGVNWWRMTGPASLVDQLYDIKRDGSRKIHLVCERTGCAKQ